MTKRTNKQNGTREPYCAKVDYSKRCAATDKYQDRCEMCENHPGEHRFPSETIDELTARRNEYRERLENAQSLISSLLAEKVQLRAMLAVAINVSEKRGHEFGWQQQARNLLAKTEPQC